MKVLQLSINFSPNIGGLETHLDNLVDGLAKRGMDVFVLTYKPLTTTAKWKIFEQRSHTKILRIPWFGGLFYKLLSMPAVEFAYLVPGLLLVTPFVLIANKTDVIHAHGIIAGFVGGIWAAIFQKRLIISTHTVYGFAASGAYREFSKQIFARADSILCLSDASAEEMSSLGISKSKIGRFMNWVDVDKFAPQDKRQAKGKLGWPDEFTALFVGRLVPGKGVLELLESAQYLNPGIRIVIAGTGPLEEKVSIMRSDQIEYAGPVQSDNAPVYYNAADVFVMPSTQNEGFGRVTIEALACGTPVIGSNRGETATIITDKVGVQVSPTPRELAKAINELVADSAKRESLAKNGRQYVLKNFSIDRLNQIISAYNLPKEEL